MTTTVRTQARSIAHGLAARLLAHLDAGTTDRGPSTMRLPAARYVDPQVWERDRNMLRREPTVVALSNELPEAGSVKATTLGDLPVLVMRGDDGCIRGFANRCTHRGTTLMEGRGRRRRLVCPFHGWAFDQRGRLDNVTDEDSFCDLVRGEHDLSALPTREEHGLVWMSGTAGASLDGVALAPGLDDDLRQLDLGRWHYQYTDSMPTAMNWRMLLEAGFETYHLPYLHARTAARVFHPNVITYDAFGRHFRMAFPRRTIDELRDVPEQEWTDPLAHMNLIYYLFPNTVLLYGAGMWQAYPGDSVGTATMHFNYFTVGDDASMNEAQRARFQFASDVTREEDNPAAEAAFRNVAADPAPHVVFGRNEICLQHLHRQLDAVGEGPA